MVNRTNDDCDPLRPRQPDCAVIVPERLKPANSRRSPSAHFFQEADVRDAERKRTHRRGIR
jgi:hypothetical protein